MTVRSFRHGLGPLNLKRRIDITYASLAKSFGQKLVHHTETLRRMAEMNKDRKDRVDIANQNEHQRAAQQRMALFPERAEVIFTSKDIWVVCQQNPRCSAIVEFSISARDSPGRQTLRLPRDPRSLPENVNRLDAFPPLTARA